MKAQPPACQNDTFLINHYQNIILQISSLVEMGLVVA